MKTTWKSQQQALFIQRFVTLVVLFVTIGLFIMGKNYAPSEKQVIHAGNRISVASMH